MLCPGTMLHFEMVLLECHNPSTNQGLISGIRFEPRESLIVNPKDELSGAEITVILQDEIISCVHFKLRSAILRLSGIQLLATIHNWSQAPFARRTLPLMQNAGNCNSTGISVQHKFALRFRLRQGSCLDQSQFDGVESPLLLIPQTKVAPRPVIACKGATSLACQGMNSRY